MNRLLPRRSRLLRLSGLAVSAAALAGLVHLESVWARPDVEQVDVEISAATVDESDDFLEPEVMLALAQTPAEITAALNAMPTALPTTGEPAIDTAAEPAIPEPIGPELVAVPDLNGLGVHKAVKALNKAGLKVRVRDEYGWRLGAYAWSMYKVKTQKIEAGTMVLPGSRIVLKVEVDSSKMMAQGY